METKVCCKCKLICLNINFNKKSSSKDGLYPKCKTFSKNDNEDYWMENQEKRKNKEKQYYHQNEEIINNTHKEYLRKRREKDVNFRLLVNTRNRIFKSLKGISNSFSTKDVLGMDIESYKRCIEWQMIPEMKWGNFFIDHVRCISSFDISKDEELKEAFNWKNTQPLLKEDNLEKGKNYNELDYRLQFFKAYQLLKLNEEERLN